MEHRDGTPRRHRTKRRNETHERGITRSETDKSAARRRRIRRSYDEIQVRDEAVESSDDESDDEDTPESTSGSSSTIASSTAPPPGTTTLSPPPPPPPIATPPPAEASTSAAVPLSTTTSATLESQILPPASTTLDTQTIISAAPTVGTQTLESGTVSTTGQSAINTPIAAGETTDPPRAQDGAGLSRQSTGVPPVATAAIAVFGTLTSLVIVLPLLTPDARKASY